MRIIEQVEIPLRKIFNQKDMVLKCVMGVHMFGWRDIRSYYFDLDWNDI